MPNFYISFVRSNAKKMLPKEELKRRRTKFWTDLEELMKPIRGSHGNKVTWLSYKSHVKDLYIRMEFDANGVRLCLDFQNKDEGIRDLVYEQFSELNKVMQNSFSNELQFIKDHHIKSSGITCLRVMSENPELNFFHDQDLTPAQEFLKTQLTSLDEFWSEFKDIFIELVK